jgi:hypothetical protein
VMFSPAPSSSPPWRTASAHWVAASPRATSRWSSSFWTRARPWDSTGSGGPSDGAAAWSGGRWGTSSRRGSRSPPGRGLPAPCRHRALAERRPRGLGGGRACLIRTRMRGRGPPGSPTWWREPRPPPSHSDPGTGSLILAPAPPGPLPLAPAGLPRDARAREPPPPPPGVCDGDRHGRGPISLPPSFPQRGR